MNLKYEFRRLYQFFAFHALHQSLEEMDGITLAEVEGFLDGCNDVSLHSIRKASTEEAQHNLVIAFKSSL